MAWLLPVKQLLNKAVESALAIGASIFAVDMASIDTPDTPVGKVLLL
jgi:hypothetical protein